MNEEGNVSLMLYLEARKKATEGEKCLAAGAPGIRRRSESHTEEKTPR